MLEGGTRRDIECIGSGGRRFRMGLVPIERAVIYDDIDVIDRIT